MPRGEDVFTSMITVHCAYSLYKYTEEHLKVFVRVLPDRIAKEETVEEKSLQELLFLFPMFIQLSLSSNHILVDASIMT